MDDRPGSRRMSLRRRASTLCAAGTSGKAQSTTPLSGANTGGESIWEQEDEELDALLGPDEGGSSDEDDDDKTPKGGPKRKVGEGWDVWVCMVYWGGVAADFAAARGG